MYAATDLNPDALRKEYELYHREVDAAGAPGDHEYHPDARHYFIKSLQSDITGASFAMSV